MIPNEQGLSWGMPFKMSWSALFAGVSVASGVWLLLHVLGLAIGFSQLDPGDPTSLRAIGIGAGVWSVLTSMLALFCGGWVAARSAGILGRIHAVLHGVVLWGVTTLAGASLIIAALSAVGSSASGAALPTATMSEVTQSVGLSARDLLAPVNQRLEAAGKPTITTEQLERTLTEAVNTAVRQGSVDTDILAGSVAAQTELTRKEAREILASSELGLVERVDRAMQATSRTFWGLFAVLVASMLAAVGGAATGLSRRQQELSKEVDEQLRHVPHPQTA